MLRVGFVFVALTLGTAAVGQTFQSCTKTEQTVVGEALRLSKQLSLTAAANVGANDVFERWFGKYTQAHGELVRANLKAVVTAIRTGSVTAQCDNVGFDGCEPDTYAWVYPDEPFLIHICPNFFNLPTMQLLRPGDPKSEDGTREGTIIHELSHFYRVANTEDLCYSREVCTDMARDSASDAVQNADSYQYFAEDISHFFTNNPEGVLAAASVQGDGQ